MYQTCWRLVKNTKTIKNKRYFKKMIKRQSSTVEPVLGTLINHHNMKRINSRGKTQANKHVLFATLCYNLKKYLRFSPKKLKLFAQICALPLGNHIVLKTELFSHN